MNGARSRAFGLALACVLPVAAAGAQEAAPPDPEAPPQPAATVRDPDFGVAARHFGLQREVEMFQWERHGDAYGLAWSAQPLDSSGYAPGHDNPPFPLRGRQWVAAEVLVDGAPLDPRVLEALGAWTPFRPSFNALPGNLAATFQPQGDGLGTAEDPMDPQVGDLRIRWRELRLPPLGDRIVLENGRWRLKRAVAVPSAGAGAGVRAQAEVREDASPRWWRTAGLAAAFVLVFGAGFGLARRLRRRGRATRR